MCIATIYCTGQVNHWSIDSIFANVNGRYLWGWYDEIVADRSIIILLHNARWMFSRLAAGSLVATSIGTDNTHRMYVSAFTNSSRCSSEDLCFGSFLTMPSTIAIAVCILVALARVPNDQLLYLHFIFATLAMTPLTLWLLTWSSSE